MITNILPVPSKEYIVLVILFPQHDFTDVLNHHTICFNFLCRFQTLNTKKI